MTTAPRPWRSLPYGAHVDALVTAASTFTDDEWADMPAILPPAVQGVMPATAALEAYLGLSGAGRLATALRAAVGIRGGYRWEHHVVLAPAVVLCAAHLVGRDGLTVDAVRAACAPAQGVPVLAAIVGAALDDLDSRLGVAS